MKKTLLIAAIALISASVLAQTVTSANIVGYVKKDVDNGNFIIACPQFIGSSTNEGVTLKDAFVGLSDQSVVYAWNGANYDKYTYFATPDAWADAGFNIADDTVVDSGEAVWILGASSNATALIAGEVPDAASVTNSLQQGFNLLGNPYPTALVLSNLTASSSLTDQDVVYVWNGANYDKYTYFATPDAWADAGFNLASDTEIPVGNGFWLSTTNVAPDDLIITKPY